MNNINLPDELLSKMWDEFDWNKAECNLLRKQKLLTIATFKYRDEDIKKLSLEIVSSLDAKALAVKKVSEELNSASGIDRVKWVTSAEKMKATLSLNPKNYKAKPFKRFVIKDEKSNKERRINIPTTFDRAMQLLYMMMLEPISEATADRKSFAFRKGRSALDAHSFIIDLLKEKNAPEWFLICDIKSFYDSISHKWLLDNIPMNKNVLKEFLKAGIVFNNEIFPSDVGISLGCNISTILGNMTLDGIQKLLYDLQDKKNMDYFDGYVIRFADDVLISARSEEKAKQYLKIIKKFVAERGLQLSQTKTQLEPITRGFEFLSRFYYKSDGNIHCIPSEKAVKRFESELYDIILNHEKKWSQKRLIQTLNSKLNGWATYHRVSEAYDSFNHIDVVVSALLLNLMKKMYPKKSIKQLIKKYWFKDHYGRDIFTLTTNKNIKVIKLVDIILVEHNKMDTKQNIFLDSEYFEKRTNSQEIQKVSGKFKTIWTRQNGKCYYCDKPINPDQSRKLITKNLSSKDKTTRNMAYVHGFCAEDETIFVNSDFRGLKEIDVNSIINEIQDPDILKIYQNQKQSKYKNLYDYFSKCEKYTFIISFKEIEEIIDNKLCHSLYVYDSYWRQKGKNLISSCWLENGYSIKRLYLKEKKVTFIRNKKQLSSINIPSQILASNIPNSAKYELEQFFDYIIKKYGL